MIIFRQSGNLRGERAEKSYKEEGNTLLMEVEGRFSSPYNEVRFRNKSLMRERNSVYMNTGLRERVDLKERY